VDIRDECHDDLLSTSVVINQWRIQEFDKGGIHFLPSPPVINNLVCAGNVSWKKSYLSFTWCRWFMASAAAVVIHLLPVCILQSFGCCLCTDVLALACALNELTYHTRHARTALWCSLQLASRDLPIICLQSAVAAADARH